MRVVLNTHQKVQRNAHCLTLNKNCCIFAEKRAICCTILI